MAKETRSNSNQKLPNNWTADGKSTGKQTGAVRPSAGACNTKKGKP